MLSKDPEWRYSKIIAILAGISFIWIAIVLLKTSLLNPAITETWFESEIASGTATSGQLFSGLKIRSFPKHEVQFTSWSSASSAGVNESESPQFPCTKWSVVTTIFEPSEAVRRQANLGPEWCIVVVGDRKSPATYSIPDASSPIVYLNVDEQQNLYGRRFPKLFAALPWNHFGRKNVGFLYAIEHGAEYIWDFDDDNVLKSDTEIPTPADQEQIPVRIPELHQFPTYNPYVKFGAPHRPCWPRGLPLSHIKQDASWNTELIQKSVDGHEIGLIQSLADHDPDMDAIYRLTQPLPFDFVADDAALPILLPAGVLAPLNAQACLFRRVAFWMLLLPISVHGRVSDIWRGYAGQRLLGDLGLRVSYSPALVDQYRNPHDYLADLDSEIPLYLRAGRIEELSIELYERGYIDIEDVRLQQYWIKALDLVGFQFPNLVSK